MLSFYVMLILSVDLPVILVFTVALLSGYYVSKS
jgi:hypothetical protein